MKIALAMIVKGTNEEAKMLNRCLANMAEHVDKVFITATYNSELSETNEVVKVALAFGAEVSYYKWTHNFADARNFNFSQVPKDYDYIIWSDADDMWRGLENLKATIKAAPHIDGLGFWYLYDWDEHKKPIVVHRKTMVIKNDGAVRWEGALHEDMMPLRQLDIKLVDGIERLHLHDPEKRVEREQRNVEIASREAKMKPNDPRSFWNLANSQYGASQYEKARESYKEFLYMSESDDEKYLAHIRLADVCRALGERENAITEFRQAIGTIPAVPDAYLGLAHLYFGFGNLDKSEEYCIQGMLRKPQIHKMILYNPRDYDYNPMMLLARIYYQRNRPDLMLPMLEGCLRIFPKDEELKKWVKEGRIDKDMLGKSLTKVKELQKIKSKKKLKEELDKLPLDIRSLPAICVLRNKNFVKKESSGKDLVIYCSNTAHQWYEGGKGFIGGSEEAVINNARELSKLGWNVTVYNNCGHKAVVVDGVTYKPFWEWNYRDKQDVTILWRWAKPLDAEINCPKILVDLHDVTSEGEFTESRLKKVTKIMVKSEFHRSLFPNIPDDKIQVIQNGIDLSLLTTGEKRDPYLIVNTSSADRSMDVLPKLFKEIKAKVPKARCVWYYGWETFDTSYASDSKKMAWKAQVQAEMKEAGIEEGGRLSQAEIGKVYQRAAIMAYPTEFAEIDCISLRKAQAAGCFPVATDFGALKETIHFGDTVASNKTKDTWNKPYQWTFGIEDPKKQAEWVEDVVFRLKNPKPFDPTEWRKQFSWAEIAKRWNDVICA